jgi:hypothetical protein
MHSQSFNIYSSTETGTPYAVNPIKLSPGITATLECPPPTVKAGGLLLHEAAKAKYFLHRHLFRGLSARVSEFDVDHDLIFLSIQSNRTPYTLLAWTANR